MALTPQERLERMAEAQRRRLYAFMLEAEGELLRAVADAEARGATGSAARYKSAQKELQAVLVAMETGATKWAREAVREIYKGAMEVSDANLSRILGATFKGGVGFDAPVHIEAMALLAEAAGTPFRDYTGRIGRRVDDLFRAAQLQEARAALAGAATGKQMARNLKGSLLANGITDFRDSAGRVWTLKRYTEMVSRTVLRECETQGTANRLVQQGVTLGEVSSHTTKGGPCDRCAGWQGAILSLDGAGVGDRASDAGDVVRGTIEDARAGGLWHPNCRHNILPYVPSVDEAIRNLEELLGEGTVDKPKPKKPAPEPKPEPATKPKPDQDHMAQINAKRLALQSILNGGDDASRRARLAQAEAEWGALRSELKAAFDKAQELSRQWNAKRTEMYSAGASRLKALSDEADALDRKWRIAEDEYQAVKDRYDKAQKKKEDLANSNQVDYQAAEVAVRELGEAVHDEAWRRLEAEGYTIPDLDAHWEATEIWRKGKREYEALTKTVNRASSANYKKQRALEDAILRHTRAGMDRDTAMRQPDVKKAMDAADKAEAKFRQAMKDRDELTDRTAAAFDVIRANEAAFNALPAKVREVIGEIRPVGRDGIEHDWMPRSEQRFHSLLDSAMEHLPTDWVKASAAHGRIKAKVASRGYYSGGKMKGGEAEWALSGYRADGGPEWGDAQRCANHEAGHRLEMAVPHLLELQRALYDRRTAGEKLTWLGHGYGKSEKTRHDLWPEPYMGKDYWGSAYELVSMMNEDLFNKMARGRSTVVSRDHECMAFFLGLMAGV